MSAEIKQVMEVPKEVLSEVKTQAKPATTSGVVNQAVGFAVGIPISMFYDWIYELVAAKAITNDIARELIKIAVPLSIGVVAHVAKIPYGNYIAGTGYAIAAITAGRIIYARIKGYFEKETTEPTATNLTQANLSTKPWGTQ